MDKLKLRKEELREVSCPVLSVFLSVMLKLTHHLVRFFFFEIIVFTLTALHALMTSVVLALFLVYLTGFG